MKYILLLAALCTLTLAAVSAQDDTKKAAAPDEDAALAISRSYLDGISGGDLDDLDVLFMEGEASSIYENASDEGTWAHYKEHHLAPEQESVKNFQFTTDKETAERCGTGFLVRHTGGFSLEAGGETRKYRAAVSFTMTPTDKGLRILHLHWSSRAAR